MKELTQRPRRLRASQNIRDLVAENFLSLDHFIQPYFLSGNQAADEPINGFTNIQRWGIEGLLKRLETDLDAGLRHFLLFGMTPQKDAAASSALSDDGGVANALVQIRKHFGKDIGLFTDVCLCAYTDHGHCGLLKNGKVDNDSSLEILSKMALLHAECGADFVAPSDMMDGRVGHIRKTLDANHHQQVGILAYTAKYASNYYGPFREALDSSPKDGSDRRSYQMDFRNQREALRELELDILEGADIVMVKPALAYLDIISLFRQHCDVPVAAYNVSGEYEIVKQLVRTGLAKERELVLENLIAFRRSGADVIITYHAHDLAREKWLR